MQNGKVDELEIGCLIKGVARVGFRGGGEDWVPEKKMGWGFN